MKYLACLNRALIAFTRASHYLDVKTPEDIILNMILTILGFLGMIYLLSEYLTAPISFFSFIISFQEQMLISSLPAQLSQLLTTYYIAIKRNLKLMQQLQEYMQYKELPQSLQRRISTFYHYRNKMQFERDKKIIKEVSPYLREVDRLLQLTVLIIEAKQLESSESLVYRSFQELLLHNYCRLISTVELFKHLPEVVVAQLIGTLRTEIFMTGDEVVKAGTAGDALYYVASGTVAVYTSIGTEV